MNENGNQKNATKNANQKLALFAIGVVATGALQCDDGKNSPASAACRTVVSVARQGDLSGPCHACCLEHNAKRGGMQGSECICVGRFANSGLDRESQ